MMIRDDIIAALRTVELPMCTRARVPYGALADAIESVVLAATERAVLEYAEEYGRLRREQGWSS